MKPKRVKRHVYLLVDSGPEFLTLLTRRGATRLVYYNRDRRTRCEQPTSRREALAALTGR